MLDLRSEGAGPGGGFDPLSIKSMLMIGIVALWKKNLKTFLPGSSYIQLRSVKSMLFTVTVLRYQHRWGFWSHPWLVLIRHWQIDYSRDGQQMGEKIPCRLWSCSLVYMSAAFRYWSAGISTKLLYWRSGTALWLCSILARFKVVISSYCSIEVTLKQNLAARLCTDSTLAMSVFVTGGHTVEAYSSCGRTIDL